ncbi:MAG: hypothetical protein LLF76_12265 [Planctomycetaceae bacterium]|nr:hypothetical protein [Planctomycetaceae bacterium]
MRSVDLIIVFGYVAFIIALGLKGGGKQENAADVFTAGGRMSGIFHSICVGLSIAAAYFSGLSFLIYPSVVYSDGIKILACLIMFPITLIILRYWFFPKYIGAGLKYPYEIIEKRIGRSARTTAAGMFLLLRVGWLAAMLYAPAVAFMAMGNLENHWFWPIVLGMGLTCTVYTTLAGIQGLIITDALQMLMIIVGIVVTVGYCVLNVDATAPEVYHYLKSSGHLTLFDFSLDPKRTFTIWAILVGITTANAGTYMADQISLQRYLAVGNVKDASRSFLLNIIGVIIVLLLLAAVGLATASWYHFSPDLNLPASADKVFPYFVANQLPAGVCGLILAALLAATITTMNSGINTLAATFTLDFRMTYGKPMTPEQQLRYSRYACLIIGTAATVLAGCVEKLGTIFDISQKLLGLFLGPLLTCMLFAVMNKPFKPIFWLVGSALGLAAGVIVMAAHFSSLYVAPATFLTSFAVTAIGRLLYKPAAKAPVEFVMRAG